MRIRRPNVVSVQLCAVVLAVSFAATVRAADRPLTIFESAAEASTDSPVDRAVFAQLEQRGIQPARLCPDHVFLRRVYLDVAGTLPTAAEAEAFIRDRKPGKRKALIDRLLAAGTYADYWAMKWSDLLRVKAEFPINLWPNAAQAYHRWIHDCLRENRPYDQFVREQLTSNGSNFRVAPVNFYRALQSKEPEALAKAVALTFMGERLDKWPEARRAGMAGFFSFIGFKGTSEWKEEIVFFDHIKAAKAATEGEAVTATFPDGTAMTLKLDRDPREVFADWLISPENPWFARNVVNRMWHWLLGRGIIHEPDDIRPDNPPSNPALLAVLERELLGSDYDLKHVFRLILNSRTYQLSAVPAAEDRAASEAQFANYAIRRLDAEVLVDALNQITGTTEMYSSYIPEPFTFIPEERRSILLPDGSITSPFLEMFGRPPRDTGLESERNNNPTAAQRLHVLNSTHVYHKIEKSRKLQAVMRAGRRDSRKVVRSLYLTILSRFPTEAELAVAEAYADKGIAAGNEAHIDLAWALINSAEFLYRH